MGHISLPDIFIVHGYRKGNHRHIRITQQLLDDLTDSVQARERVLDDLMNIGQDAIGGDGEDEEKDTISKKSILIGSDLSVETDMRPFNFSSEQVMTDFYSIVQGWFSEPDKSTLLHVFKSNPDNISGSEFLIFHGNGNQLADAFKQMFEGNLIVGCSKQVLQNWIADHFLYRDKDKPKPYNQKYLSDIISSTIRECQSPILEVKKRVTGITVYSRHTERQKTTKNNRVTMGLGV